MAAHRYLYAPSEVDRILCWTRYTNSRCRLAAVTMSHASAYEEFVVSHKVRIRGCEKNPRRPQVRRDGLRVRPWMS
jgi:hypothetical protein